MNNLFENEIDIDLIHKHAKGDKPVCAGVSSKEIAFVSLTGTVMAIVLYIALAIQG